jgi:hypothetical protein
VQRKPWLLTTEPESASRYTNELVPEADVDDRFTPLTKTGRKRLSLWKRQLVKRRVPFYEDILHPRSFDPEFMARRGFAYTKYSGKNRLVRIGLKRLSISQADFDMATAAGMPFGYSFKGGRTIAAGIEGRATSRMLAEAFSESELFSSRYTSYSRFPVSELGAEYYLGRASVRSATKAFSTTEQGLAKARDMFGQEMILRGKDTGDIIPYGRKKIMGVVRGTADTLAQRDLMAELARFGRIKEPTQAFEALRRKYFDLLEKGRAGELASFEQTYTELLRNRLSEIGGERAVTRPGPMVYGKKYAARVTAGVRPLQREFLRSARDFHLKTRKAYVEKIKPIAGFRPQIQFAHQFEEGTEFVLGGGKKATLERAKSISQITAIDAASNRPELYGRLASRFKAGIGAEAPDIFPVRLVRAPGTYGGEFQPWATKVITGAGEEVGWVKRTEFIKGKDNIVRAVTKDYGKTFSPNVTEGLLPDKLYARVYARKKGKRIAYSLGLFPTQEAAYGKKFIAETEEFVTTTKPKFFGSIPQRFRAAGVEKDPRISSNLGEIFKGSRKGTKMLGAPPAGKTLEMMYPTRYKGMPLEGAGSLPRMNKFAKGALIGAAITAGAMMLWSASREKKRTPLDESEIPQAMSGEPSNRIPDVRPLNRTNARIRMNNTPSAYRNQLLVEMNDDDGKVDYREMANTLSALSRNALGVDRANVNLHIQDDSTTSSRRMIQRKILENLNR